MKKVYVVSWVGFGDTNDSHPSCHGVAFNSRSEAENYVKEDMMSYCDSHTSVDDGGNTISPNLVDFDTMEVFEDDMNGCCWSIDEILVDTSM